MRIGVIDPQKWRAIPCKTPLQSAASGLGPDAMRKMSAVESFSFVLTIASRIARSLPAASTRP